MTVNYLLLLIITLRELLAKSQVDAVQHYQKIGGRGCLDRARFENYSLIKIYKFNNNFGVHFLQ